MNHNVIASLASEPIQAKQHVEPGSWRGKASVDDEWRLVRVEFLSFFLSFFVCFLLFSSLASTKTHSCVVHGRFFCSFVWSCLACVCGLVLVVVDDGDDHKKSGDEREERGGGDRVKLQQRQ